MTDYYLLGNGDLISKKKVEDALDLIRRVSNGCTIVQLSDSEVFTFGDKVDAIKLFKEKYDCTLLEAKSAIDFLREE